MKNAFRLIQSKAMGQWRIFVLPAVLAGALQGQDAGGSVLGGGWGLDHAIVLLATSTTATEIFGAKLGFSVVPGTRFPGQGLDQATVKLPPAYLEFLWPYQKPTGAEAIRTLQIVEAGAAPIQYNLDVSPVEGAADAMRRLGFKVSLPPSATRIVNGKEEPGPWQFITVSPEDQRRFPLGVPGGPLVGFLEYRNNAEHLTPEYVQRQRELAETVSDPRRLPEEINANTARRLRSVWVAVSNVAEAVKQSQLFGFVPGLERQLAILGARGREVQCGEGQIVFWESAKEGSDFSKLIEKRGLGPFGVSIGVADLNKAHQIVEQGTQAKLPIEGKRSFLVPAEMAGGVWVEFIQE